MQVKDNPLSVDREQQTDASLSAYGKARSTDSGSTA